MRKLTESNVEDKRKLVSSSDTGFSDGLANAACPLTFNIPILTLHQRCVCICPMNIMCIHNNLEFSICIYIICILKSFSG
jgi:hypothetical protein